MPHTATRALTLASALLASSISPITWAEPGFARQYKSEYGYQPSCNACHKDGGGTPLNSYGEQFKKADMKRSSFKAIAALDADGDGTDNNTEIRAKANPGDASSTPGAAGDWLDTANLIPKSVQNAFAGITQYKPLDAIFTEKEITRAAARGVTLTAADENTIYIPVKGKAVGTAIIVPAVHEGTQFFLMLATNRKLEISTITPLSTQQVTDAENSALYQGYIGQSVAKLPTAPASGLPAAIDNAVRKAGTILLVRLKKG